MNVQQRHVAQQVALELGAIVHIHKLAGDQPAGEPPLRQPGLAKRQKVAIKPGQAAQSQAASLDGALTKAQLFVRLYVVMAHVRRIADQQVEASLGLRFGEVLQAQREPAVLPQAQRRKAVVRIELEAHRVGDPRGRKDLPQRGIERASAERRIEEAHPATRRQLLLGVAHNVQRQPRRRRELPQAIALGLSLLAIERGLQR